MAALTSPRSRVYPWLIAGRFYLAIMAGALASPAWALDTSLENVVINDRDGGSIIFPRIEFTGTNLSQDELAKLFAEATPVDQKTALFAKLRADRITIPKAVATNKDSTITVSGIAASAIGDGKVGRAELAGIDGTGKTDDGGPVTITSGPIVLEGADLSSLLTANPSGLRFSRMSWTNLAITAPDKDTPATAAGGNLYVMKIGSLTADATFDGPVLLKAGMSLKGLSVQPPMAAVAAQQLKTAGFDKLELAFDLTITYNPATKVLALDNLMINGTNAGSLRIRSALGGVDKAVFSSDGGDGILALLQATVSSMELEYVDAGLAAKLTGIFAQQQGKQPAALQSENVAMARQMLPFLLTGAPNAQAIGDTVARFVAQPTSISVTLKPKAGPIGILDLAAVIDPATFFTKIDADVKSASPALPAASASGPTSPSVVAAPPAVAQAAPPAAAQAAPPAVAQAAPPAVAQAAPRRLTGLDAWNALVGNTIAGKNSDGDPFAEFYLKNGTVKQLDDDETATGKWSLKNGKVCFEFPDDDEETCYHITVEGNIATFTDDDGSGRRYEILAGNAKHL